MNLLTRCGEIVDQLEGRDVAGVFQGFAVNQRPMRAVSHFHHVVYDRTSDAYHCYFRPIATFIFKLL